jgi:hypothetical protein
VNRAGGRSGSLRNIGRIEQWNVGSGAGRAVPAADAERPLSVSKAVALLPANRPCRLLGQVLSSKIFVTNRGAIYQVVKP